MEIAIDKAGRLVIPKPLRERAGIKPGVRLNVEYRDGRIEIEPVHEPVKLVKKGTVVVATRQGETPTLTNREVLDAIRATRDERGLL